ncbi:unnamed protein product, partial [Rotaria magnacalcarata]
NNSVDREKTKRSRNDDLEMKNQLELKNINDTSRDAAHALSIWDENPEPLSLDNSKNDDQDASFDLGPMTTTIISFVSPSTNSLATEGAVERVALPMFPPTPTQQHKSVLLKAYFKQRQQSEE